ncbi:MAG: hypothetical protein R3229_07455 [Alphaproteobacteria bacterium]|nr:hypothetical protein [Alphaproteobacteria bacterium]
MKKRGARVCGAVMTVAVLLLGSFALADCAGSLPRSERVTKSKWATFAEAKATYDQVQPGLTNEAVLRELGYDPYGDTNVRILSYLDIHRRFRTGDTAAASAVPIAVQSCLAAQGSCFGYEVNLERLHRKRTGSAFLDLLNFRRVTHETGWKFRALFVIHHNLVVYKLWSGEPNIDRRLDAENPLGPVQEPTDVIKRQIP